MTIMRYVSPKGTFNPLSTTTIFVPRYDIGDFFVTIYGSKTEAVGFSNLTT